jgi:hypothetical protein
VSIGNLYSRAGGERKIDTLEGLLERKLGRVIVLFHLVKLRVSKWGV